ncbi:MAG: hypothetical protein HFJ45_04090 [Clostridia bacterium]|nr:hypothetical protein [Clostridia bacterium]
MKEQKKACKHCGCIYTHTYTLNEKGITLIALIITIIVLLILAGVSIALVTGENGIIGKAGNSKEKTEQGVLLDELRIEAYEEMANEEENNNYIEYFKTKEFIKAEVESGEYLYYIIDVKKVTDSVTTGKGTFESGDVYYISNGELYYKKSGGEVVDLGTVFKEIEKNEELKQLPWIWHKNPDGTVAITGLDFTNVSHKMGDEFTDYYFPEGDYEIPKEIERWKSSKFWLK